MATVQKKVDNAFQLTGEALLKSDAIGPKQKRIRDTLKNINSALEATKEAKRAVVKAAVDAKIFPNTHLAELAGVTSSTIKKWSE